MQESNVGGGAGFRVGPPSGPAPTVPKIGPGNGSGGSGTKVRPPPPPNASLHSSNDSGFSNDPPPAPEIDYSDDEPNRYAAMDDDFPNWDSNQPYFYHLTLTQEHKEHLDLLTKF